MLELCNSHNVATSKNVLRELINELFIQIDDAKRLQTRAKQITEIIPIYIETENIHGDYYNRKNNTF